MKFIIALILVIIACAQGHQVNNDQVTVYTQNNFGTEFNFDKPTFFLLYAPWCGHCKRLMPTWNELQEKMPDVRIAAVDCDSSKKFCGNFAENGRMGYPMLRFVGTDEKVYTYSGARDASSLIKFATGGYKNASKVVDFPQKLKEELKSQTQQKNVEL
ncbi:Thioredoxin-like fold [Pseudocohnilembus persalinus]|uniref:Thioredoxin-like fold n=1 Tax=Pseudocohnilembus persalinus TaxID=266149 RepID=A0A0V0R8W4_PSEPJ|nr:Thioredoxin-like fold [Pseudocohnilembus persalinus]|eukprot:KRX10935.1 Thioredoxin-like fold [Pseudocohnilembus persalinus]